MPSYSKLPAGSACPSVAAHLCGGIWAKFAPMGLSVTTCLKNTNNGSENTLRAETETKSSGKPACWHVPTGR